MVRVGLFQDLDDGIFCGLVDFCDKVIVFFLTDRSNDARLMMDAARRAALMAVLSIGGIIIREFR